MEESSNWVVQNLQNALGTWNDKLSEIWLLITQSPEEFKDGTIWNVITNIHGALQAIGYSLLVLFFVVGVMKTCGNFAEMKRPEIALKMFIRFILAKAAIDYGLELMMALFDIVQGIVAKIMATSGLASIEQTVLPDSIIQAIEESGFWESVPLWAVTLIGSLFITVLSFIMIMTVYGRFFKIYLYTATIINRKLKKAELKEISLLERANDDKDKYRKEINDMLTMIANGANANL